MASLEIISSIFLWSTLLLGSLCSVLLWVVHKLWLGPVRTQRIMASQGIKGPPYRFLHGNTKEISQMRKEAAASPLMGLSHDIFYRVQPQVPTWINTYGISTKTLNFRIQQADNVG